MAKTTPPYNISKQQKEWADQLIETGSQTEAAMRSYNCKDRKVAAVIGYQNAKNINVQTYVSQRLHASNLISKALQKLEEQLEAKLVDKDFNLTDAPNHIIQNKALKQVIQLGLVTDPKNEQLKTIREQDLGLDDNTPDVVLEWMYEHGRVPTEPEAKRLLNGHEETTGTTTEGSPDSK